MISYRDNFQVKHNDLKPEKGRILISEPFLQDAYFQRSVVLLIEHGGEGSMGFVVNKQTDLIVNDFFPELKERPVIPIYLGGPVSPNHLFFIHSLGMAIPGSVEIGEDLYFDGDFEVLKHHLKSDNSAYGQVKFFLGYSGWTKEQLDSEIVCNSWLVGHSSCRSLILARDDSFWNHVVERLGHPYSTWINYPKNPEMN